MVDGIILRYGRLLIDSQNNSFKLLDTRTSAHVHTPETETPCVVFYADRGDRPKSCARRIFAFKLTIFCMNIPFYLFISLPLKYIMAGKSQEKSWNTQLKSRENIKACM